MTAAIIMLGICTGEALLAKQLSEQGSGRPDS
jgi:hypothetical protein